MVNFRGRGFRWPLRNGDTVELWAENEARQIAEIPQAIVLAVLRDVVSRFREPRGLLALEPATPPPPQTPEKEIPMPPSKPPRRLRARPAARRLRGLAVLAALILASCAPALPPPFFPGSGAPSGNGPIVVAPRCGSVISYRSGSFVFSECYP